VLNALCYDRTRRSDQGVLEECEAAWRSAGGKHQSKTKNKTPKYIGALRGGGGKRGERGGWGAKDEGREREGLKGEVYANEAYEAIKIKDKKKLKYFFTLFLHGTDIVIGQIHTTCVGRVRVGGCVYIGKRAKGCVWEGALAMLRVRVFLLGIIMPSEGTFGLPGGVFLKIIIMLIYTIKLCILYYCCY